MTFATSPGFEIKSADLALVALLLKTANVEQIAQGLQAQFSDSPDFFDQDPLLIDLSGLSEADAGKDIDFSSLVRILGNMA